MTEEDLQFVKYAVNTHVCLFACTVTCTFHSRITVNMSEWVCCGTDELLYSDRWEAHRAPGGVSMSHMCHAYTHTPECSYHFTSLHFTTHTHAQIFKDLKGISTQRLHSVTPSQIKTNGFILFSRRDCLAHFFMSQKCIL